MLEYPAAPSKRLIGWFIDHPERLVWPAGADAGASPEAVKLRRALIEDDPPGSRARAQERARDVLAKSSSLTPEWWRLEAVTTLDCVLITERLAITVVVAPAGGLAPATPWYPQRSQLVRGLEAARHLADGKRFASLVLSERPLSDAGDERVRRSLPEAAPHLDEDERAQLADAYLGNLTWDDACQAVGIAPEALRGDADVPE